MRLEEMDVTTRHHRCPDCKAAAGDPHLNDCPSDESDAAVERTRQADQYHAAMGVAQTDHEARYDAEAVQVARSLIPEGRRYRTKDELYRALTTTATRRHARSLRDSERQQLWRASHLLWASGEVHEGHEARAGAVA